VISSLAEDLFTNQERLCYCQGQTLRDIAYHSALRSNDRAFRKNVKANRTTRLRVLLVTSCSSKGSPKPVVRMGVIQDEAWEPEDFQK